MLVIWACGLNRAACAARSLSQACGELSTSTGPCIVGRTADEYPPSTVHCTSGSPAADFGALAFCRILWLCQLLWRSNFRWLALFWLGSSISVAGLRLRLNLCSLIGCLPPAFTVCLLPFIRQPTYDSLLSHQLNETLARLNLWKQVQKSGKSVDITRSGAKGPVYAPNRADLSLIRVVSACK
jgi:hypothetical protein